MIDGGLILLIVVFLIVMALVAGIGIGLVIGLVLGSREEKGQSNPAPPSAAGSVEPVWLPVPAADPLAPDSAQPAASAIPAFAVQPAAPQQRAQAWTVALAMGVILTCCACTFLLAAITTVGQ